MGKFAILTMLLAMCFVAQSQTATTPDTLPIVIDDSIYKKVDIIPEFPGGKDGLMAYLAKVPYPPFARECDLEGTVYIQFVIEADGHISNIVVARSSGHAQQDKAAMEHIQAMPQWTPGRHNGKPVRVQYVVPVKFKMG